jgi:hypothetical protein
MKENICSFCYGKYHINIQHVTSRFHINNIRRLKDIPKWWLLNDKEFKKLFTPKYISEE